MYYSPYKNMTRNLYIGLMRIRLGPHMCLMLLSIKVYHLQTCS
jgi:hypothetical protein